MRGCLTSSNIMPLVPTSCMPGIILLLRLCLFHRVPLVFVLLLWLSRLRNWIVIQLLACIECVYCSYFGLSCLLIFLLRSHSFFLISVESCTQAALISWQGSDTDKEATNNVKVVSLCQTWLSDVQAVCKRRRNEKCRQTQVLKNQMVAGVSGFLCSVIVVQYKVSGAHLYQ